MLVGGRRRKGEGKGEVYIWNREAAFRGIPLVFLGWVLNMMIG